MCIFDIVLLVRSGSATGRLLLYMMQFNEDASSFSLLHQFREPNQMASSDFIAINTGSPDVIGHPPYVSQYVRVMT